MKTSTKNTILTGIFTIIASIIGIISYNWGENAQTNEILNTVQQSGLTNVNKNDSSVEIVNKLLNEYINLNNKIISLNEEKHELMIKNNTVESENESLRLNITTLQEELDNAVQENEKMTLQLSEGNTDSPIREDVIKDKKPTYKNNLSEIYIIDSSYYETIKGFSDSYGNSYSLAYQFDASNNAYAKFNVDKKYQVLTGYVTASPNTGKGANMTIEIYGDDILLTRITNITKETEAIPLDNINITDIKKLTINTYNTGAYNYGYLYIADAKLN